MRQNLTQELAKLRQIQKTRTEEEAATREQRQQIYACLANDDRETALAYERELELSPARRRKLQVLERECQSRVDVLQPNYVEKRKQKRQAEIMRDVEENNRNRTLCRKEQRNLDEWYLLRPHASNQYQS